MGEIVRYLSFWTVTRDKCWFEFQVQASNKNIYCIGAFGAYRRQAIHNAEKRVGEQFPFVTFPSVSFSWE